MSQKLVFFETGLTQRDFLMRQLAMPYIFGFMLAVFFTNVASATESTALDRSVLPIPEPNYPHSKVLDARDATPPPRFEVKAPEGAPNVLIVLIDDMGFGMSSAFGGPIQMPTVEHLASQGLRYNQFHTTALCSPTRTASCTQRLDRQIQGQVRPRLGQAARGNSGSPDPTGRGSPTHTARA